MRTQTFEIPPQEVCFHLLFDSLKNENTYCINSMQSDKGYGNAVHLFPAFTTISIVQVSFQILTKDSVTVFVNAIMYYKVANATHAVSNVDD